jgi:hypothetical protein
MILKEDKIIQISRKENLKSSKESKPDRKPDEKPEGQGILDIKFHKDMERNNFYLDFLIDFEGQGEINRKMRDSFLEEDRFRFDFNDNICYSLNNEFNEALRYSQKKHRRYTIKIDSTTELEDSVRRMKENFRKMKQIIALIDGMNKPFSFSFSADSVVFDDLEHFNRVGLALDSFYNGTNLLTNIGEK